MPQTSRPEDSSARRITVGEISARRGVQLNVDADVTEASPLISGQIIQRMLPDGLQIHGGDTVEEQAFRVESSISDGLSCIFFLRGNVDVAIGGKDFSFRADGGGRIAGSALLSGSEESFRRQSDARQRVTHLVVGASSDWLERHAPGWSAGAADLSARQGLRSMEWAVSHRISKLIAAILQPPQSALPLVNLHAEAHAIEIIAEAITVLSGTEAVTTRISDRHLAALKRAKDFIAAHAASDDLSVETIARHAGVSVSGLQTLFRQCEGNGVFTHVRNLRLDLVRARLQSGEIDIAQASGLAGYSSAANFSTAFRRRFGHPPRHIRQRRH
ncbi:helix-turn-helix transcriptional regulator [Paracoccus caeni]|uniref:Helix-turn-helix transcriptional regulator n=1 Tax=Paracoccus caeni TaxID=657651 RepID=A0A934VTU6_9RHOB|nr:AraC family transcriptional regulator [Paracoccus caeni]MBK4215116.1 helix-turn-helix transcriptional regulator [Paracoccus caeni]